MHRSSFCRENEDTTSRRDANGMMVSTGKYPRKCPIFLWAINGVIIIGSPYVSS